MVTLHKTLNPVSREERVKINENWDRIMTGFSNLQYQINFLSGEEVDVIITRIETAITNAQNATADTNAVLVDVTDALQRLIITINNANTATTSATNAASSANTAATNANMATSAANAATTAANQAAANTNAAIEAANRATKSANTATANANAATAGAISATDSANQAADDANVATASALQAIQDMLAEIDALNALRESIAHIGTYATATQYYGNNEVLHLGSTFRAKKDTLGNPPPSNFTSNEFWQLIARRGEDAPNDTMAIWRGAEPPSNTSMLWWYDADYVVGEEVYIYRGEIPPTDTKHLWLAPREVI